MSLPDAVYQHVRCESRRHSTCRGNACSRGPNLASARRHSSVAHMAQNSLFQCVRNGTHVAEMMKIGAKICGEHPWRNKPSGGGWLDNGAATPASRL